MAGCAPECAVLRARRQAFVARDRATCLTTPCRLLPLNTAFIFVANNDTNKAVESFFVHIFGIEPFVSSTQLPGPSVTGFVLGSPHSAPAVRDMLVNADDLAIITGAIGLSKAFGRDVIAEGVETTAHAQRLLVLNCPQLQGYAIARPMPACEVSGWVSTWLAAHGTPMAVCQAQSAAPQTKQLLPGQCVI